MKSRIQARLDALGKSARSASLEAGLGADAIRNVLRDRSRHPRSDTLSRIAQALEVSPQWLLYGDDNGTGEQSSPPAAPIQLRETGGGFAQPQAPSAAAPLSGSPSLPARQTMPQNVPVMGTAAGSATGAFQLEAGAIDFVRRPPGIQNASDVYAIYIVGMSMHPRFDEGELVYVSERRPVRIGDYVIVQIQNGDDGSVEAYCKRLVKRSAKTLYLEQLNPQMNLELPMETVRAVHRILTLNELFGI